MQLLSSFEKQSLMQRKKYLSRERTTLFKFMFLALTAPLEKNINWIGCEEVEYLTNSKIQMYPT
jgi:hypothetical protein